MVKADNSTELSYRTKIKRNARPYYGSGS